MGSGYTIKPDTYVITIEGKQYLTNGYLFNNSGDGIHFETIDGVRVNTKFNYIVRKYREN